MPNTANRKRPIQVKFFVDEHELAVIKQRMGEFGTNNLSTYLRTMAMEGIFPTADSEENPNKKQNNRTEINGGETVHLDH